jgi:hypothetical protein
MKKMMVVIGLVVMLALAIPLTALASSFQWSVNVTNSTSSAYSNVPFTAPISTTAWISSNYIQPNGLDIKVMDGSTALPTEVTDTGLWWVGNIAKNTTKTFTLSTGNTPATSMPIVAGNGGQITTPDNASLELGSDFTLEIDGYIDASGGADKDILEKGGALSIDVQNAGTLQALDDNDLVGVSGAISSGVHDIKITGSSTSGNLELYIDNTLVDTESGFTAISDTSNSWIWDTNNVMPYINYVKISTSPGGSYVYVDKQTGSGDSITDTIYQLNASDLSESGLSCVLPRGYVAVPHSICCDGNNIYIIAESGEIPDHSAKTNYDIFKIDVATMTITNTRDFSSDGYGYYDGQFYLNNGTVMVLANGYLYTCISTENISTSSWSRALYKINTADMSFIDSTGTALQTYINYGFQALASYNGDLFVLAAGGDACITEVNESSFTCVASNNTTVSHYAADIAVVIPWTTTVVKLLTRDDISAPQGYPLYAPNYWYYSASTLARLESNGIYAGTTDNDTAMLTYPDTGGFLVYFACNGMPDPPYTVYLEAEEWAGSPDFGTWVDTNNEGTDEGYALAADDASHVFVDTNNAIYKLNGLGAESMGAIASSSLTGASFNIAYGALSGNPTEVLKYQPNTIITGTDLPNLDDGTGDTDGVITWGTAPSGTTTTFGSFMPVTTATAPIGGSGGNPTSQYSSGMPSLTSEGNFSNIPGASVVDPVLNSSDIPLDLFWDVLIFVGILGLGFAIMVWTNQIWIVGVACSVGFAIFSYNTNNGIDFTGGVLPFWTVIVCIMATIVVGIMQDRGVIKI